MYRQGPSSLPVLAYPRPVHMRQSRFVCNSLHETTRALSKHTVSLRPCNPSLKTLPYMLPSAIYHTVPYQVRETLLRL